jgi:hypothetical protein
MAGAEVVLDQEFKLPNHSGINYYLDYPGDYLAQTFTVRHTGELAGVGVQASVSGLGQFVDNLHIRVTRVDNDGYALMNEVLAEAAIAPSQLPIEGSVSPSAMTDVNLSSWHVPVTIGDRLAVLFTSNHAYYSPASGPHYVWFFQIGNPHPGGEFSIYSPKAYGPTPLRDIWLGGGDKTVDAGFHVYVNLIPEPNSLLLFFPGAVGCCWLAKKCPVMRPTPAAR